MSKVIRVAVHAEIVVDSFDEGVAAVGRAESLLDENGYKLFSAVVHTELPKDDE